jgi:EAL domain-containing protein (putative c-di-GMP-specific phosphodiesterase class I)
MPASVVNSLTSRIDSSWSLVSHGDGSGIALRKFPCQVGRQPGLEVRILHPTVSLVHAEIRREGDKLNICDLGSRNGTFVNGKRLTQPQAAGAGDLIQFGGAIYRLNHHAQTDITMTCQTAEAGDLALALAQFDKLISEPVVVPFYQPIVQASDGKAIAYEALARSSLFGLDNPAQMFRAAEYFQMEAELSRLLRKAGLTISSAETQPHLFLNTHPAELADLKRLILSLREIRRVRPKQPITLEVHEAAAVDLATIKMLRLVLTDLGMTLAYDDFGAGQARLNELVEARPDFLKFDRKLIAGLNSAPSSRQQLVQSLVSMSRQLEITTLAEGVETEEEARACQQIGFELMQGFYFGRPAKFNVATVLPAAEMFAEVEEATAGK